MVYGRFGVFSGKNLMHGTVTVLATGRGCPSRLACLYVNTSQIRCFCILMTLGTRDLFGCRLMNRGLDVGVAVDACIHGAVDGMLQFILIHIEADALAMYILGQSRVGVAGQTVLVLGLGLLLGTGRPGPRQDTEHEASVQNSLHGVHAIDKIPSEQTPQ